MAKRNVQEALKEEDKRALNKTNLKKLFQIFRFMMPHKGTFFAGCIALFFSSGTLLVFPRMAGELLDIASGKPKYFANISSVAIFMFVVLILQGIFSFVRVYTFALVTERGLAAMRKSLFQKIMWLPMTYFDRHRVGEMMSRISADVSTLGDTLSLSIAEFFRQIVMLIGGTIVILIMTPRLTGFMLLTFPVLIILAMLFGKKIRSLSGKSQDKLAQTNVIVEESLQSVAVVKAFTNEVFEINRYTKALSETVRIALSSARYRGIFISFLITVIFGGIVAVGCYGAVLVKDQVISTGELFSFVLYTTVIGASIAGLGDIYSQLQRAIGASERVLETLEEPDEQIHAEKLQMRGEIEFSNVTFAYPTRQEYVVLKDLNFKIRLGEKVALVGQSGSGKSTIISLLMRFYPISKGTVAVDGKDVTQYNLSGYRGNIGIVPQEVILFGGTIEENIAYGKPGATSEEIREAARKANALDFIESFPEKFATLVGERGVKLSGGQRQRIAIARAILKDPAILILDEATSSLDAQSEVLVQEALEKLMVGRTTIIIAHRLSTIKKVDRIFVIKEGALAETGSHAELSNVQEGIYSNLLKLQLH
jgi:ABC-type multidrug transport system fused ATPase/permease subunit